MPERPAVISIYHQSKHTVVIFVKQHREYAAKILIQQCSPHLINAATLPRADAIERIKLPRLKHVTDLYLRSSFDIRTVCKRAKMRISGHAMTAWN